MQKREHKLLSSWRVLGLFTLLGFLAAGACGRSELDIGEFEHAGVEPDSGLDASLDPDADDPPDRPDAIDPTGGAGGGGSTCIPTEEVCNGVDDDCNGETDEVSPIPCPEGGSRYCVSGAFSACPKRCEMCIPGSERVCFLSYCTYWGVQTCSADGRSFSFCREERAPSSCIDVALDERKSAELEQCCIDQGYCCRDEFDLDSDGDRGEMLGRCDDVRCQ